MPLPKGFIVVPCGFNAAGELRSMLLDASDRILLAFESAEAGLVGINGQVGGFWRKQPLLPGYSGTLSVIASNLSVPAGDSALSSAAVPAGEIHIIQAIDIWATSPSFTRLSIAMTQGGNTVTIANFAAPVTNIHYTWTGQLILSPGEYIRYQIFGATLNDDLYGRYGAVRCDIDL